MKHLSLILIAVMCLSLTGCWRYGSGTTIGYVTTVENGIFWDYVWIRAELESSQTNPYVIRKDRQDLKDALLKTSRNKERVEVNYFNHIIIAVFVEGIGGEVYGFELVK